MENLPSVERLEVCVFLPDLRPVVQFRFDEEHAETMAEELLSIISEQLAIDTEVGSEALALWLVSPLLEIQMKQHHRPLNILSKWPDYLRRLAAITDEQIAACDDPILVLRRNVLLTLDREIQFCKEFSNLADVMYTCAKNEYLLGRYLVELDVALELAGLQMAIDYGPFVSDEQTLDLIWDHCGEFFPPQYVGAIPSFRLFGLSSLECRRGLEQQLVNEYREASQFLTSGGNCFMVVYTYYNFRKLAAFFPCSLEHNIIRSLSDHSSSFGFSYQRFRRRGLGSFVRSVREKFSNVLETIGQHDGNGNVSRAEKPPNVLIGINQQWITLIDLSAHQLLHKQRLPPCSVHSSSSRGSSSPSSSGPPGSEDGEINSNASPSSFWSLRSALSMDERLSSFLCEQPFVPPLVITSCA